MFFGFLPACCSDSTGWFSAFCGPLFGPAPGFAPASVGAAGSVFGASLCVLRKAITFALSCGLLRPAKVILVPGAKARGLVSHWLRLSQFQVPPFFAS